MLRARLLLLLVVATGCLSTSETVRTSDVQLHEPRRIGVSGAPDALIAHLKRAFPQADFCNAPCDADWIIEYQQIESLACTHCDPAKRDQYRAWTALVLTREGNAALIHGSTHKLFDTAARDAARRIRALLDE